MVGLPLPAFVPHSRDYGAASSLRLMQPPNTAVDLMHRKRLMMMARHSRESAGTFGTVVLFARRWRV